MNIRRFLPRRLPKSSWRGKRRARTVSPARADLSQVTSTHAPHGALEMEGEDWDVDRLRNWVQTVADMGRKLACAGAIEVATGELVGFTVIGLPRASEHIAAQFGTVVAPNHRGHRLGILVKIANLRNVAELAPPTRRVRTWNALGNDPMIRLNVALGFEVTGGAIDWHKTLGERSSTRFGPPAPKL